MTPFSNRPLVAVDVGNSRIKLGVFDASSKIDLPEPSRFAVLAPDLTAAEIERFLSGDPSEFDWSIASVNRPSEGRLREWLAGRNAKGVQTLKHTDLPLVVDVARPDRVGIDRLADAVAVNRLRDPRRAAIVIDIGSAIKVDLVTQRGSFAGGAILPGIAMSARALHEFTDLLPLIEANEAPPVLGTSTESAMRSGLYWGALGGARELVTLLAAEHGVKQIFLTGGGAPNLTGIVDHLPQLHLRSVPHLTLSGIAISAVHCSAAKE